jgi:hypothetical protein
MQMAKPSKAEIAAAKDIPLVDAGLSLDDLAATVVDAQNPLLERIARLEESVNKMTQQINRLRASAGEPWAAPINRPKKPKGGRR